MPIIGDEHIIAARVAAENVKRHSITNEVKIDGVAYRFEEREFPPYFSMVLPESFEALPFEYVKAKYPYEDRPEVILSNGDAMVNFAFDIIPTMHIEINERLVQYKTLIKKLHPDYVFFSENIERMESGPDVAYYDYRGAALDEDVYYFSFFADITDSELFGWFNCPVESQSKWEPLVRQMIKTIKPLEEKEQEEEKDA